LKTLARSGRRRGTAARRPGGWARAAAIGVRLSKQMSVTYTESCGRVGALLSIDFPSRTPGRACTILTNYFYHGTLDRWMFSRAIKTTRCVVSLGYTALPPAAGWRIERANPADRTPARGCRRRPTEACKRVRG